MNFRLFRILAVVVTVVMLSNSATAQNEPKKLVEAFFEYFQQSNPTVALDKLYATNKWASEATGAIGNLTEKLKNLSEDYIGKMEGYELIAEKKLSKSYILLSYLVKYDRQPTRYTFQFYKPKDKWMIYTFQFDANIGDEMEEAAKLHFQKL